MPDDKSLDFLYSFEFKPKSAADEDAERVRILTQLAVPGPSGKRYREYISKLQEIRETDKASSLGDQQTSEQLITLLWQMVSDALVYFCDDAEALINKGDINLCVTGSLARRDATAFSDIDCFMIIGDKVSAEERAKIDAAVKAVSKIADLMFYDQGQFCFDPLGMSLLRLTDTKSNLLQKILASERDDIKVGVLSAVSVTVGDKANSDLSELKEMMKPHVPGYTPDFLYQLAVKEFQGPSMTDSQFSIKRDFLRPVDFILQGLVMKNGKLPKNIHDPYELLNDLVRRKVISKDISDLILCLKDEGNSVRKFVHGEHNKEHEMVPSSTYLQKMVALVGVLRASVDKWVEGGKKGTLSLSASTVLTNGQYLNATLPSLAKLAVVERLLEKVEKECEKQGSWYMTMFREVSSGQEVYLELAKNLKAVSNRYLNEVILPGGSGNLDIGEQLDQMRSTFQVFAQGGGKNQRSFAHALTMLNDASTEMHTISEDAYHGPHIGMRDR